jgi:hypothetical protein
MIDTDQKTISEELFALRDGGHMQTALQSYENFPMTPNPQTVPEETFPAPQMVDSGSGQQSPTSVNQCFDKASSSAALKERKAKVKINLPALCDTYVEMREKSGQFSHLLAEIIMRFFHFSLESTKKWLV